MITKIPVICLFGYHSEVGQTTMANQPDFQSPSLYRYCIQSVCAQQGRKRGVKRVQASDITVDD